MKYDPIQAWLDNVAYSHSKSESTAYQYRKYLNEFCSFVDINAEGILEDYEGAKDRDFKRKYAQYLRAFVGQLSQKGYAPSSIHGRVASVKSFFKYNDLTLGYVPTGRHKVVYHNRDITHEEISQILTHASNFKNKAYFSLMAQSGLRPSTISKLKYEHIKEDFEAGTIPMCIKIPAKINKGEYGTFPTFAGEETIKYLKLYLKGRPNIQPEEYLFVSQKGKNKPINPKAISRVFNRLVRKLEKRGILEVKGREYGKPAEIRLYNLRKWFRKHAGQAGQDYVNFWMGHRLGVDDHYFSRDVEHHREVYKEKAMPYLRLEQPTPLKTEQTITELRRQITERDRRINGLEQALDVLSDQVKVLEKDKASIGYLKDFLSDKEARDILTSFVEKERKVRRQRKRQR